jgi:hypothetical protein
MKLSNRLERLGFTYSLRFVLWLANVNVRHGRVANEAHTDLRLSFEIR